VTNWPVNAAIPGGMLKPVAAHMLAVVMPIAGGGLSLERE
jgi:hypothetical protein